MNLQNVFTVQTDHVKGFWQNKLRPCERLFEEQDTAHKKAFKEQKTYLAEDFYRFYGEKRILQMLLHSK